jgi:hypothetical protein
VKNFKPGACFGSFDSECSVCVSECYVADYCAKKSKSKKNQNQNIIPVEVSLSESEVNRLFIQDVEELFSRMATNDLGKGIQYDFFNEEDTLKLMIKVAVPSYQMLISITGRESFRVEPIKTTEGMSFVLRHLSNQLEEP